MSLGYRDRFPTVPTPSGSAARLLGLEPSTPHPDRAGEEPSVRVAGLQIRRQLIKLLLSGVAPFQGAVEGSRSHEGGELRPRGADLADHLNLDLNKSGSDKQAPQLPTDPWILTVGEPATEYPLGQAEVSGVQRIHLVVDVNTHHLAAGPQYSNHLAKGSRGVPDVQEQQDAAGQVEGLIGKVEGTYVAD